MLNAAVVRVNQRNRGSSYLFSFLAESISGFQKEHQRFSKRASAVFKKSISGFQKEHQPFSKRASAVFKKSISGSKIGQQPDSLALLVDRRVYKFGPQVLEVYQI